MRLIGVVEGKGLYARWNNQHNQVRYNIDGEDVAVYDMDSMTLSSPIVFRENTLSNELSANAKDTIQNLARKVNVDELKNDEEKYGNNSREYIAESLELDDEDIVSITEIELDKKLEKHSETAKKKDNKEKLATTKDIKIKQELKMSAMATDMKSIGKVLKDAGKMPNMPGKKFTKLGIVESDRIKNIDKNAKRNTTRFSFVAIATDGTVVPLNLEQDHQEGSNPREISYRNNANATVEQDDVNSRFKIGNSGETISIKFSNGPGNIEVGYSPTKTIGGYSIDGNMSLDTQLETSTVYWKPRKEARESQYRGIYQADEKYKEAMEEGNTDIYDMKSGKKGVSSRATYKEIDGRKNTKSHEHVEDEGRVPWEDQRGR